MKSEQQKKSYKADVSFKILKVKNIQKCVQRDTQFYVLVRHIIDTHSW